MKNHTTNDFQYECEECGKQFGIDEMLVKHKQISHWKKNVEPIIHLCRKCGCEFTSEETFEKHMNKCIVKKGDRVVAQYDCKECENEFNSEERLSKHMNRCHTKSVEPNSRQYNCEDCSFQGESGLELKKHIQRTKHIPSETIEQCYTCKKEFSSYWHLMNHRKTEHPSKRTCRYFKLGDCRFDDGFCWYIHATNSEKTDQEDSFSEFTCNDCDKTFDSKSVLMKHKKIDHRSTVLKCRDFVQKKCSLSESSCWFLHDVKQSIDENHEESENEESGNKEQVFHMASEKTPPDQMTKILSLINKLSLQVEILEIRTKINQ